MRIENGTLYVDIVDDYVSEKGLPHTITFVVYRKTYTTPAGQFSLSPMPGCCGIAISHNSFLNPDWRGGLAGKDFHDLKQSVAKLYGYSAMLATTQLRNIPEVVGACKKGWRVVETFRNKRTDNDLAIMVKQI